MTDEHNPEAVAELLPCPFCGGAAKMHRQRDSFGTLNLSIANISCDRGCVHQSGYRETDVSIAAWNRRIPALVIATGRDTDAAVEALRADAQAAAALVVEKAGLAVANVEIGFHDGISGEWHPMAGPSIISAACAAIRALAPAEGLAAVEALRKERDSLRRNLRESFEAMCAMRDAINEHVPMPSLESDLLQGPETSVFCAAVAEAVIADRDRLADELAAAQQREAEWHDGSRPLPFDRDTIGRMVREAWVRWAETQPSPKPSWLVPYGELNEADKEADRQIGEAVARWTLAFDAARAALSNKGRGE